MHFSTILRYLFFTWAFPFSATLYSTALHFGGNIVLLVPQNEKQNVKQNTYLIKQTAVNRHQRQQQNSIFRISNSQQASFCQITTLKDESPASHYPFSEKKPPHQNNKVGNKMLNVFREWEQMWHIDRNFIDPSGRFQYGNPVTCNTTSEQRKCKG